MDPSISDLLGMDTVLTISIIAMSNVAVITSVKQALKALGPKGVNIMNNGVYKACQEIAQPLLGGVVTLVPGILDTIPTAERVMVGIVAGFLSPMIYRTVLKRILPGVFLPQDHPSRAGSTNEDV